MNLYYCKLQVCAVPEMLSYLVLYCCCQVLVPTHSDTGPVHADDGLVRADAGLVLVNSPKVQDGCLVGNTEVWLGSCTTTYSRSCCCQGSLQ